MEPEGYEKLMLAVENWFSELGKGGNFTIESIRKDAVFRAAVEMVRGPKVWDTVDALTQSKKKKESLPPPSMSWEEALHEELFKDR